MRIPKKFKVKGTTYKVELVRNLHSADNQKCDGLSDLDKGVIYLDRKLKGDHKRSVFFHEVFHVIVHEAHINVGVRFSEGIEEVFCDAFSSFVMTSFTDLKWKKEK